MIALFGMNRALKIFTAFWLNEFKIFSFYFNLKRCKIKMNDDAIRCEPLVYKCTTIQKIQWNEKLIDIWTKKNHFETELNFDIWYWSNWFNESWHWNGRHCAHFHVISVGKYKQQCWNFCFFYFNRPSDLLNSIPLYGVFWSKIIGDKINARSMAFKAKRISYFDIVS